MTKWMLAGLVSASAAGADPVYDANSDGMVTVFELELERPELSETDFILLDENGDGVLDTAELQALTERPLQRKTSLLGGVRP